MRVEEHQILNGIARLRDKGHSFEHGLTDAEVANIELQFGFTFPPDLRFFLQSALPTSGSFAFFNWRGDFNELQSIFDCQIDGILFDVEKKNFWWPEWGPRPNDVLLAIQAATKHLQLVPKLIPFAGAPFKKCIPASPVLWGNPVFSIHQTDILHAGRDLGDFLRWYSRPTEEFERDFEEGISPTATYCEDYRNIQFWTDLVKRNLMI